MLSRLLSIVLSFVLSGSLLSGCQSSLRNGPAFQPRTPPRPPDALVYVYRYDALRGVGDIDVRFNEDKLGRMRNRQYLALLVDPGQQKLTLRLKTLGIIQRAWTDIDFVAEPGSTTFIRFWAGYDQPRDRVDTRAGGPAPGRADGNVSVSVFAGRWSERDALDELKETYRGILPPR